MEIKGRFYKLVPEVTFDEISAECEKQGTQVFQLFQEQDLEVVKYFGMKIPYGFIVQCFGLII